LAFAGWKLFSIFLLSLFGAPLHGWQHSFFSLLLGCAVEGALGFWLYQWLEKFDWITYKNARAEHALDSELLMDGEGF